MLIRGGFLSGYPIPEKNPDPGDKKFPGYPEGEKSRKTPESRGFSKNPDSQKIVKTQNFLLYFLKIFQISLKISKVEDQILGIKRSVQL